MLGVHPLTRLSPEGYAATVTRAVYCTMNDHVLAALEAGETVIADAVFSDPLHREAIAAVAREAGVPFMGLWIDAPGNVLAQRIADRALDVSDATVGVLADQLRSGSGTLAWPHLDGTPGIDQVLAQSRRILAEQP
jgi:predicted kinase